MTLAPLVLVLERFLSRSDTLKVAVRLQPTDPDAQTDVRRVATVELRAVFNPRSATGSRTRTRTRTRTRGAANRRPMPALQHSNTPSLRHPHPGFEITCRFRGVTYYLMCFCSQLSSVVEQRFCKPSVVGSNPTAGSSF
jgi:hypothetical protein